MNKVSFTFAHSNRLASVSTQLNWTVESMGQKSRGFILLNYFQVLNVSAKVMLKCLLAYKYAQQCINHGFYCVK